MAGLSQEKRRAGTMPAVKEGRKSPTLVHGYGIWTNRSVSLRADMDPRDDDGHDARHHGAHLQQKDKVIGGRSRRCSGRSW
jgi:hypothetical protein